LISWFNRNPLISTKKREHYLIEESKFSFEYFVASVGVFVLFFSYAFTFFFFFFFFFFFPGVFGEVGEAEFDAGTSSAFSFFFFFPGVFGEGVEVDVVTSSDFSFFFFEGVGAIGETGLDAVTSPNFPFFFLSCRNWRNRRCSDITCFNSCRD